MTGALRNWARVDTGPFDFGARVSLADTVRGATRPLSFRAFVDLVHPRYQWYRHCEILANVLQRVADGDLKRAMVFMPPRHGKSETVSRLFPAYYLYRHPERWTGVNSYAAGLAYTFSRAARDNYIRAGGKLSDDAAAVGHWETGRGGGLWAAGVGGPITGKGFHLGLIDDPLKNAEEASSEVIREKQWDWYNSTFYTRAEPDAAIVVVLTRWHEDDLAGRLLEQEADEPERWHIVNLPAIAEDEPVEIPDTCTAESDWREPGEPLCPERYSLAKLRAMEKRIGTYFWGALYQQRPRPKEGNRFKWDWFGYLEAKPAVAERVRYWDTAGTEGGGDYTVGVLMARTPAGEYVIEDVVRGQWSPSRRDQEILAATERDAATYGRRQVVTWLEHEAGIGGKERTQAIIRLLAGHKVHAERVTGSKESRADPLASQAEAGNVKLFRAPWNRAFLNELCDFPHGKHDDQVDAASGAFNKLALAEPRRASVVPWRV